MRIYEISNTSSHTKMVKSFLDLCEPSKISYYKKTDNCGPAALDFIDYVKQTTGEKWSREQGYFVTDIPLHHKLDFTTEMKKDFISKNMDFNSASQRLKYIEDNFAEEWRYAPHYWVVDAENNIHDPSGKLQFVDTGLSADTNVVRYSLTDYQ